MSDFLAGIDIYDEVEVTEIGNKPKEPTPGAYVLKILGAKIERFSDDKVAIKLQIDIAEGEYADYYKQLYEYNKSGKFAKNAKWKGTFRIWYPVNNGDTEEYKRQVASLKRCITAINDSNSGKKIDPKAGIDPAIFKGKKVGGAFGLVDLEYNGKEGTRLECRWLVGVDRVKAGEVETPAHKGLKGAEPKQTATQNSEAAASAGSVADFEDILSDDDPPF
jgi:hypothetical protein